MTVLAMEHFIDIIIIIENYATNFGVGEGAVDAEVLEGSWGDV
jgi:hypothetical protein